MQKKTYYILLTGMGLLFLWYLFRRAALLSITHDESGTTDLVTVPVWDIMFSPKQFQTANNHILNSLLMKASVSLFGYKEWAVRLPNVLSFVLYFSSAAVLMHRLTGNLLLRLGGVLILCSAHYLLDFFSLARGYGLANAFGMAALVLLLLFFDDKKNKWLYASFISAALACYANFTWMNLYLGLWALLNLSMLVFPSAEKPIWRPLLRVNIPPLLMAFLLALVSYKPISFLRTKEEFKWGAVQWTDSFHTFCNDLLYGQTLLFWNGEQSKQILMFALPVLVLILVALLFRHRLIKKSAAFQLLPSKVVFLTTGLLVLIILGTVAQKHLLNTFYIDGRKATLYFPILLSIAVASIAWLETKQKQTGQIVATLTVFITCALLAASINFYQCREWWYDANSKEVAYTIQQQLPGKARVAVTWQFHPSITFYNRHQLNNQIQTIAKTTEAATPDAFDFYYVMGDELRKVPPVFKPVKRFFWDRFLLQKDTAWYRQQLLLEQMKLLQTETDTTSALQKAALILQEKRNTIQWDQLLWKE